MAYINVLPTDDVYISSLNPNENFSSAPFLLVGNYTRHSCHSNIFRSLIKFNLNPDIPYGTMISRATLYLYVDDINLKDCTFRDSEITIYRNTQNFNENSVIWNNAPTFESTGYTRKISVSDKYSYIGIDITDLVKGWALGIYDNYGVTIRGCENVINSLAAFSSKESSNPPILKIFYQPILGPTGVTGPTGATGTTGVTGRTGA
ncbi:DNRLRE domain-containing protein, partial [Clostridium zeae]|uniref:DNRLRE domain-containing protein n=1 Tax=Clostridium zeae TaxID=2759022 RepID=UPI001A8E9A02